MFPFRCIVCTLGLLALGSAHAESMRCGKWIVDEQVSVAELQEKCGPPTEKTSKTEDVMVRNPTTGFVNKTGTQITERWVYRRPGALPMAVTVVDGKIQRLERTE